MSNRYNDILANFDLVLRKNKAGYTAEKRILDNTSTNDKGRALIPQLFRILDKIALKLLEQR